MGTRLSTKRADRGVVGLDTDVVIAAQQDAGPPSHLRHRCRPRRGSRRFWEKRLRWLKRLVATKRVDEPIRRPPTQTRGDHDARDPTRPPSRT
jgi:hypothetical protein